MSEMMSNPTVKCFFQVFYLRGREDVLVQNITVPVVLFELLIDKHV